MEDASSGDPVPETKQQEEEEPATGNHWTSVTIQIDIFWQIWSAPIYAADEQRLPLPPCRAA